MRRVAAAKAALLIAAAGGVRLVPFLTGNDDGDVGAYVVTARALLHGSLPYLRVWEYKPPGLFAVYAAALAVAGDGSHAAALLGLLASVATTLLLWRLVAALSSERAGLLAGLFWAFLSIEFDGLLGDAELLAVPFVAAATLAAIRASPSRAPLVAGLLAAAAVQMKLTALFVVPVPLAALAVRAGSSALAFFAGAFLSVPALEALVYAGAHAFGALWDANAGATLRRLAFRTSSSGGALPVSTVELWGLIRRTLPIVVLAPFAPLRAGPLFLWLWLGLAVAGVVAAGEYDLRQWLPALAPLAALGGVGLDALLARLRRGTIVVAAAAVAATFALHGYFEVRSAAVIARARLAGDAGYGRSEVERIASRLRARGLSGARLWVLEATPMLYDDLASVPPTRYVVTSNLLSVRLWPMLGFRGETELERILEEERPTWIVAKDFGPWCDPDVAAATRRRIDGAYREVERLDRFTRLYRRRP